MVVDMATMDQVIQGRVLLIWDLPLLAKRMIKTLGVGAEILQAKLAGIDNINA